MSDTNRLLIYSKCRSAVHQPGKEGFSSLIEKNMIPLFETYPMLAVKLPYLPLCNLPTPVEPLGEFGAAVGINGLYIKRDDQSGELYGGNKVRSLEFLLGSAHRTQDNVVVGLAGANMALAANVYAAEHGFPLRTLLVRQEPTAESQANLLHFAHVGAKLEEVAGVAELEDVLNRLNAKSLSGHGRPVFTLDPNSLLGMVGYVNAGYELQRQVAKGRLPEPDRIYVAAGLLGTASGLLLGICTSGLSSKIYAVSQEGAGPAVRSGIADRIRQKFEALASYLQVIAPDFPLQAYDPARLEVLTGSEADPQRLMNAGLAEGDLLFQTEGIRIDATWTAQVIGAILEHAGSGQLDGRMTLFWYTNSGHRTPPELDQIDYHQLPEVFWRHFETDELALVNKPG